MGYFSLHKLGRIIKAQKDTLPTGLNKNVVYRLNCKNCDVSYVGQTKRRLNTRTLEHKKDINKKTSNYSVITKHRMDFNHVLRPNLEDFVYKNWKEGEGGGTEGRTQ